MRLFLSIEAQCEETGIQYILSEVNQKLSFVTAKDKNLENTDNYGQEFSSIAVIPTCVSEKMWVISGWKERRFISRKKREADIRLKMDYERFKSETKENKYILFADVIIKSILVVSQKSKGDFNADKLIDDILNALDITKEELSALD